jgi:hypothetical protein
MAGGKCRWRGIAALPQKGNLFPKWGQKKSLKANRAKIRSSEPLDSALQTSFPPHHYFWHKSCVENAGNDNLIERR